MAEEAFQTYQEALKLGQKEYKYCVHQGRWPHIQPLAQVQPAFGRLSQTGLGLMEIPLYLIVGSAEDQRCNCFSPSFYPLMGPGTEFSAKWTGLCRHQMAEGISDPIKCYEYLGHFYVVEGNKRVSVLRTLGGTSIWANVTRLMPEDREDISVQLYMEFLEFYRSAGFYGIHFSDLGGYARLQAALGYPKGEKWPEEVRRRVQNCFMAFRGCFYKLGGAGLGITSGDALLKWLKFYGAEDFLSLDEGMYRQTLTAVWKELAAAGESAAVEVKQAPEETEKRESTVSGLVGGLLRPKKLKVAFLFWKDPEESPWTAAHDEGRAYMEKALGDSVSVLTYYNVPADEGAEAFIQAAVEEGAELIYTTSVKLLPAALRAAVKYPKVRIMNCSIGQPYVNVAAYYSRIYEGKFVTGAIAGALCKSGRIGYVGSYPILGVPASINAFALGASLTNPDARIVLKWHCLPGDYLGQFREEGFELVSNRDSSSVETITGPKGLFRFGEGGETLPLASPVWRWGEFYVRMTRGIQSGGHRPDDRAVNYWWGMSAGTVGVLLDDALPEGVRALADMLSMGIRNGTIRPFRRHITDQSGAVRCDGTQELSMDDILKMDWLCDRVEGSIPPYEELLPIARSTVRLLGIHRDSVPPEEGDR